VSIAQRYLNPFDPKLEIKWPIEVTEISDLDKYAPILSDLEESEFIE
jgi:dTDP-4-dehydrorhamnose 3,5-epimerase-like enzyme